MKIVVVLLISCLWFQSQAQQHSAALGVVIDTLPVSSTENESFALYLPKSHSSEKASFIVFIFDPAARGSVGIRPFIPAAEKYNLMLVCSNNSRNGPFDKNLQIANNLFDHVLSNFNIAKQGIYTAGFSGGSRLAVTIAVLSDAIQGVVGCGAAFSGNSGHLPTSANSFSYAGLIGTRDMNYLEMHRAARWLNKMNIANELFTYEDDHRWPPEKEILRAFEWLELRAYYNKIKPVDQLALKEIYTKGYITASQQLKDGRLLEAVNTFEMLERNFSGYYNLDSISAKVRSLKKSKEFKQLTKAVDKYNRLEDTLSRRFSRRFHDRASLGAAADYRWWKNQLQKLDKNYLNSEQSSIKYIGQRLRYQLFALAIESFDIYVREGDKSKAIYAAGLLELLNINMPFSNYRLASGFAKLGLTKKALHHMEGALRMGMDVALFQKRNSDFKTLQNNDNFILLLKNYSGKSN